MRAPIGDRPAKSCRAAVWLSTTTRGAAAVSDARSDRPAMSGTPIVSKIVRADGVQKMLNFAAVDDDGRVGFGAGDERVLEQCGGRHARNRLEAFEQSRVKTVAIRSGARPFMVGSIVKSTSSCGLNPRSTLPRLCSVRRNSPAPATSGNDTPICSASSTRPILSFGAPAAPLRSSSDRVRVAAESQRRQQAGEESGGAGDGRRGDEERPVERHGDAARAEAGRDHRLERGRHPQRDDQTGEAARDAEQDAFEQQLANDAPASGAERPPHGQLALPRHAAREHQARDVEARDEQHDAATTVARIRRGSSAPRRSESSPRAPGKTATDDLAAISGLMPPSMSMLASVA